MARVYGLSGELSDNIYVFATLTAAGTSEAIEVQASMFTFQHVIVGASITYKEQGSLDIKQNIISTAVFELQMNFQKKRERCQRKSGRMSGSCLEKF